MARGVNRVIILGRLGTDPEVKYTQSGTAVTRFNVATNESWLNKEGQKEEKTEWHRIVVWGKQAENCGQYLAKGRQVYVEGRLQTSNWEDKDGNKRYTTEIIAQTVQFIDSRAEGATTKEYNPSPMPSDEGQSVADESKSDVNDIPF
jgi:single-strand DNA-binding protein